MSYNFHGLYCIYIDFDYNDIVQRITIPEIKKHPWFLKNLPKEFIEEDEASVQMRNIADEYSCQSIEEALAIIQEAREPGDGAKTGGPFMDGSMDLDDLDTDDADIDEDIETSDDFVCAV